MAIVDLQRWDRRKRHHNNLGAVNSAPMDKEADDNDEILVDDFDIRRLCNLISKPLRSGAFRYRSGPQPSARTTSAVQADAKPIVRITGADGSLNYLPKEGETVGKCRQQTCFICHRYKIESVNTQWKYHKCEMPLCQITRSNPPLCPLDCIEEHLESNNKILGCGFIRRDTFKMPDELRVTTAPTCKQKRKTEEQKQKRREERAAKAARVSVNLPEATPMRRSTHSTRHSSNT
jgi:hypothetical protein